MLDIRTYIIFIFLLVSLNAARAQCGAESGADIIDLVETEVELVISGALNDDLASIDQGVCAVYLEFQHTHVGDLQIELESPSGQRIQLIGEPGEITGPTDLTNWDVRFVPCGELAEPDMGFSGVWDNDQSWGIIGNYEGSYHPNVGCLEDFENGTVNGTWRLVINDDVIFDEGEVLRFCLEFCDDEGIDCFACQICDADAGSLQDTIINYCFSDLPVELQIPVEDSAFIDSAFVTSYYLWQTDVILDITSSYFLDVNYEPGIYTLCALNYFAADSFPFVVGDTISIDSLELLIETASVGCVDLSHCINIEVHPNPDTIHIDTHFCSGEEFLYKNEVYDSQGVYPIVVAGPICDTMYMLDLEEIQILTVLDLEYVIVNCEQAFKADGLSSLPIEYDSALWFFDGDYIQTSDTILLFQEGEICLTIYENGCSQEFCLEIDFEEVIPPTLQGVGNFCPGDSVLVFAVGDYDYEWSNNVNGDSSYFSTMGNQYLIYIDSIGCSDTLYFTLSEFEVDSVEIFGEDSICFGSSTTLFIEAQFDSIIWNPESNDSEIEIADAGWVSVSAGDTNHCRSLDSIFIFVQDAVELELEIFAFACGTPGGESELFFDTLITSGSLTGDWEDIDVSGASGVLPNLDFLGVIPGTYSFGYTTDNAVLPCMNISDTINITVFDCACPIIILAEDSIAFCLETDMDSIDLGDLLFSSEAGEWSIKTSPQNSNAEILSEWFIYNEGDSGLYNLRFELIDSIAGCSASIELQVLVSQPFYARLSSEIERFCVEEEVVFDLSSFLIQDGPGEWMLPYELVDAFDEVNSTIDLSQIPVGIYSISFAGESQQPCSNYADTMLLEILAKPDITLSIVENIPCLGKFGEISAVSNGDQGYWYTIEGGIIGDSLDPTVQVSLPGLYYYVSNIGDCSSIDSVEVLNIAQSPTWEVDFTDSICAGTSDGFLIIDNISSGENSLVFINEQLQSGDSLLNLGAGDYILTVIDSAGCFDSDTISIHEIHEIFTITPDTSIYLGDSLTIELLEQMGLVDTVDWLENGTLLEQSENSFKVFPLEATNFIAYVISTNGCKFELETQIDILDAGFIFVPNVFSPNGDDINDKFLAYGNERFWNIEEMSVFNRFGEQVFRSLNHKPGDSSFGWDGSFKGERAAIGVYSYFVVVYSNNGQYRMLKGDVTLLR